MREWGVEQIVRDVRVAMIYEGTNEIQAQDLLFRKVLPDAGAAFGAWLAQLQADLPATAAGERARADLQALQQLGQAVAQTAPEALYPVAGDFLRCVTLALMAWAWALLDARGPATLANGHQAYVRWVRPEAAMRADMVRQAL